MRGGRRRGLVRRDFFVKRFKGGTFNALASQLINFLFEPRESLGKGADFSTGADGADNQPDHQDNGTDHEEGNQRFDI